MVGDLQVLWGDTEVLHHFEQVFWAKLLVLEWEWIQVHHFGLGSVVNG